MKRQTDSTLATRVYSNGTVPERIAPVRNEAAAIAQMRLGQRLWNTLVAIERTRAQRYVRIMTDPISIRIAELTGLIAQARAEIKARRKAARKRAVYVDDLLAKIAEWKAERARLIEYQKATKEERHEARRAELDALSAITRRRIVKARQAAARMGLFWGSYNDIVQRADAGRKLGDLQFRGFRGTGTVTAQIMNGMSVAQVVSGGNNFFQIDPATPGQKWRYARMRIGSNADRSPVWLEIPIVYHRDLPKDGTVKSVSMTRRVVASHPHWQLNVTLTMPKAQPKSGPAIAVDLGWRALETGVRVAFWQDEAGKSGEVVVSAADLDQFVRADSLKSICDLKRDEFLPQFAAWLGTLDLPPEWKTQSSHVSQWRSSDRLAALIRWWSDHRLPGDEGWFYGAKEWRKKYLHLSGWQRNLQDQLTLRVREQYRVWSAGVARNYGTVVLEKFDLREVAAVPQPEGERQQKGANRQRQWVSPSVLRGALKNACTREGLEVGEVEAAETTNQCHRCLGFCKWDHSELWHTCEHCGEKWDQDQNAAANLLRLWLNPEERESKAGDSNTAAA